MVDRGMKKFNAFKALTEHGRLVDELAIKKTLIDKPVLTSDAYEIINYNIMSALENNKEVELKYYKNGKIHELTGFLKVDNYNKALYINETKIDFSDILEVR